MLEAHFATADRAFDNLGVGFFHEVRLFELQRSGNSLESKLPDSFVKSRRQPILGLKGQNIVAQGNAPGVGKNVSSSPERASQMIRSQTFVTPFQG